MIHAANGVAATGDGAEACAATMAAPGPAHGTAGPPTPHVHTAAPAGHGPTTTTGAEAPHLDDRIRRGF
ncbi:hypothetical protein [Nocardiopsis sp. YSL2]|uniref:hypothetical protein n=1 Tax=Nocardiopsis sp. YSL2 TaxID=2939492 RepID=UPI0026F45083|nr:hypothetical protein [Nocardiopsis sp. YSL2]